MADTKISAFTDGGVITDTDQVAVARSGANRRVQVGTMAAEDTADWQPKDADLTSIAGQGSVGFLVRNGSGSYTLRSFADGAGFYFNEAFGLTDNPSIAVYALRTEWVLASQMRPATTNGCAALAQVQISANQPEVVSLDFDASTEEYALFAIAMPKSWDEGTVSARLTWSHAATASNFAVIWGLQAVAISNDDPLGVAFGTAQEVTDTGGTTNDLYLSPVTAGITISGTPAAGDVVFFRVYRKAAAGGDTMTIDARLHGVELFYTVNSFDDT